MVNSLRPGVISTVDTKICSTCKVEKTSGEFSADPRYKDGLRSQCALCRREAMYETRLNSWLMRTYGISLEKYNELRASQGNVCRICRKLETRSTRSSKKIWEYNIEPRLVVDHNHITGEVRGLLCHKCNIALGQFNDDPNLLERGVQYLLGELND